MICKPLRCRVLVPRIVPIPGKGRYACPSPSRRAGMPDKRCPCAKSSVSITDLEVPAYSKPNDYVPDFDTDYVFAKEVTLAILAGFKHNRRVMVQGYHGTGKSSHVEQVAARLNWPCVRVNLDSHVRPHRPRRQGRHRPQGRQAGDGVPRGHPAWALQNHRALCFDEYDAGRTDVMFVIQRVLEVSGKLTLLDQSKVIRPHPCFRLFATTTRSASATPQGSITARSRSTRARWTAVDRRHAELPAA